MTAAFRNEASYTPTLPISTSYSSSPVIANLEATINELSKAITNSMLTFETSQECGGTFNFQQHIIQPFAFIFKTLKDDVAVVQQNIVNLSRELFKVSEDKDKTIQLLSAEYQFSAKAYENIFFKLQAVLEIQRELEKNSSKQTEEIDSLCLNLKQVMFDLKKALQESGEKSLEVISFKERYTSALNEISELYNGQSSLSRELEEKNRTIESLRKNEKNLHGEIFSLKEKLLTAKELAKALSSNEPKLKEKDSCINKLLGEKKALNKEIEKKASELKQCQTILSLVSTISLIAGAAFLVLNKKNLMNL